MEPSPGSSIAGFGVLRSGARRWLRRIIPIFVMVSILAFGWWLARRPFAIPENTAALMMVWPKNAQSLRTAFREKLPRSWQTALLSSSRWPVILGAWNENDQWSAFALMPRWRFGSSDPNAQNTGLYGLLADNDLPSVKKTFRLTDAAAWKGGLFANAKIWINPTPILAAQNTEWELNPFTASLRGSLLETDVPFPSTRRPMPLKYADISANMLSSDHAGGFGQFLFREIRIGDLTLNQLPLSPTQISIALGENGAIRSTRLVFGTPLTQRQAALILSGFGINSQQQVQLPDGTIMLASGPINSTGTRLFSDRTSPRFGTIRLSEQELNFGDLPANEEDAPTNNCQMESEWLLLSPKGLLNFAKALDIRTDDGLFPSILFGSKNNYLSACLLIHKDVDK